MQFSGVESHKSIGAGESYHHPLRRIYLKLKEQHSSGDDDLDVRLSTEIKDTAGPSCLSPSILVYGFPPAVSILKNIIVGIGGRMRALANTKGDMARIHAENRINKELKGFLTYETVENNLTDQLKPSDTRCLYRRSEEDMKK